MNKRKNILFLSLLGVIAPLTGCGERVNPYDLDFSIETKGTSIQMEGCFAAAFPNDHLETVTITRPNVVLGKKLMFSLERDGYIRATHVSNMNLSGIISSVKFYRKIHPKE